MRFLVSLQYVPIEALMKRNSLVALQFLQWFKALFDKYSKGRGYHALEARGGQRMSLASAESGGTNEIFLYKEPPVLLMCI